MRRIRRGEASGPARLLELAEEAHRRFCKKAGRPTAAEWDIRRLVPLRLSDWQVLTSLAHKVGLSPAQLAALLIEKGVDYLRSEPQKQFINGPRQAR